MIINGSHSTFCFVVQCSFVHQIPYVCVWHKTFSLYIFPNSCLIQFTRFSDSVMMIRLRSSMVPIQQFHVATEYSFLYQIHYVWSPNVQFLVSILHSPNSLQSQSKLCFKFDVFVSQFLFLFIRIKKNCPSLLNATICTRTLIRFSGDRTSRPTTVSPTYVEIGPSRHLLRSDVSPNDWNLTLNWSQISNRWDVRSQKKWGKRRGKRRLHLPS